MTQRVIPIYDNEECNQFVKDMVAAGLEVRDYQGRWFWTGPAAVSSRDDGIYEQDIYRATSVPCQSDNLGFDYIIYPRISGKLLNADEYMAWAYPPDEDDE